MPILDSTYYMYCGFGIASYMEQSISKFVISQVGNWAFGNIKPVCRRTYIARLWSNLLSASIGLRMDGSAIISTNPVNTCRKKKIGFFSVYIWSRRQMTNNPGHSDCVQPQLEVLYCTYRVNTFYLLFIDLVGLI